MPRPFASLFVLACVLTSSAATVHAQSIAPRPDVATLRAEAAGAMLEEQAAALEVRFLRDRLALQETFTTDAGTFALVDARDGFPVYLHTLGKLGAFPFATSAPSASAGPLTGQGVEVGVWDGGAVRRTHQEVAGRVSVKDRYATVQSHATHIGGIIAGQGVEAPGIAPGATLRSHDWGRDRSEMMAAAAEGLRVSNHSYGQSYGWVYDARGDGRWAWLGNARADSTRDHRFGQYDWLASAWDGIAHDAPGYLIVKAAGNDRGEGPAPGTEHWIVDPVASQWVLSTTARERDGGAEGYATVLDAGNGKNVLTVGAAAVSEGEPQTLAISAWGPTDDGRIKPDLTAPGQSVYSSTATSDASYASMSGTSMAAAAVTGSVASLLEVEAQYRPGSPLRASTYRALLLHTAREMGPAPGPDYRSGWGLLDRDAAAVTLDAALRESATTLLREETLEKGDEQTIPLFSSGTRALRVTLAWTDPEGVAAADPMDAPASRLVNDLDLWLTDAQGQRYEPWVLDPDHPAQPATRGVNTRDNVEQVLIETPRAGRYELHVRFARQQNAPAGAGTAQAVSILATGLATKEESLPVELTAFDGLVVGGGVQLRWATASETNNAGFAVEHAEGASEAWDEQAFVAGHGTTAEAQRYVFTLGNLAPGTHRFRLRQTDFDGAFDYSPVVEVEIGIDTRFAVGAPAPNPFRDSATLPVTVQRTQHLDAHLYDALGRRVATLFSGTVEGGQTTRILVDGAGLAPGLYLLRLEGEVFVHTERLTRVR